MSPLFTTLASVSSTVLPITATRSPLNNTKGSAADTDNKVAKILTTIMGRVPFNSTW